MPGSDGGFQKRMGSFQGALFSVCCERYLFGLDVNHFGVGVKVLTDGDDICFVSCGGLKDDARGVFSSRGNIVPITR